MDVDVGSFALDISNFVDVEGIEEYLLFFDEQLGCQFVFVDIDESMVIDVPLFRDLSFFDLYHEDIAILISEFLGTVQTFRGRHESIHLDEYSRLQSFEIS